MQIQWRVLVTSLLETSWSALLRLSTLAVIQTLQFAIVLGWLLTFIPTSNHIQILPPLTDYPFFMHPCKDADVYRLSVLFFLGAMITCLVSKKAKSPNSPLIARFLPLLIAETALGLLLWHGLNIRMGTIAAEIHPGGLFGTCMAVWIMSRVWLIYSIAVQKPQSPSPKPLVLHPKLPARPGWRVALGLGLIALLIVIALEVRDIQAIFDNAYYRERQVHNSMLFMGPAYFFYKGGMPVIDCWALYGVGLPLFFGSLCKMIGAFNIPFMLFVGLNMIIIYGIVCVFLFYRWTGSFLMTVAGAIFLVNYRMFGDEGGASLTFTTFNSTPIRYYLDIFFLAAVAEHWHSRKPIWMAIAAFLAGTQLLLTVSTGLILIVMMAAYALIEALAANQTAGPKKAPLRYSLLWLGAAMGFYFAWMALFFQGHLFSGSFWDHYLQQVAYFSNGVWNLPHLDIMYQHPWTVYLNCVYALSFFPSLYLTLRCGFADVRPLLICMLSLYGLLDSQHFIMISTMAALLRNATIPVVLSVLWIDVWLHEQKEALQAGVKTSLIVLGLVVLLHNDKWQDYPNILHPQSHLMPTATDDVLKNYFDANYSFKEDEAMIASLTSPDQPVVLISEHEMLMLSAAGRKPFFYYFPLVVSQRVDIAQWPSTQMYSRDTLQETIDQITRAHPEVIFVEKKLWQYPVPAQWMHDFNSIYELVKAVRQSYVPFKESPYLLALEPLPQKD